MAFALKAFEQNHLNTCVIRAPYLKQDGFTHDHAVTLAATIDFLLAHFRHIKRKGIASKNSTTADTMGTAGQTRMAA
jgi:hypothetical protein